MYLWHLFVKPRGSKRGFFEISTNLVVIGAILFIVYKSLFPDYVLIFPKELGANDDIITKLSEVKELAAIILVLLLLLVDLIISRKRANWLGLVEGYPFKGSKEELELTINSIEYNGYISGMRNSISITENGVYLCPLFFEKFLYSEIYISWDKLKVTVKEVRKEIFKIPFGKGKEMLVIQTLYQPHLRLRIKKGELKIDFERMILSKVRD